MNTQFVTGKVRFSYCNVHKPKAHEDGGEAKYGVSILIRKKDKKTLAKIAEAIEAAEEILKVKCGGVLPKKYRKPLRDGDEEREDDEAYEGMMFMNASSKQKPDIVDANREEIINEKDFYSGCYGRAALNMFAYNVSGSKGIACGLNFLQFQEDGERLGGGVSTAAEAFNDEDDDLN